LLKRLGNAFDYLLQKTADFGAAFGGFAGVLNGNCGGFCLGANREARQSGSLGLAAIAIFDWNPTLSHHPHHFLASSSVRDNPVYFFEYQEHDWSFGIFNQYVVW
jgi:hypothetical protein